MSSATCNPTQEKPTSSRYSLLGIGTYLPPTREMSELIAAAGGDPASYRGWKKVCVAGPDDHPSTMALAALRSALAQAGVDPSKLRIVISTGSTFDRPPSWSVANEVMRMLHIPSTCVGFDISQGCVAGSTALEVSRNWLESSGSGYAAIICGQRWAHTMDRTDRRNEAVWAWADGASAMVFGMNAPEKPLLDYLGTVHHSEARLHGMIHTLYGGTLEPFAPPGVNPYKKDVNSKIPAMEMFETYSRNYTSVIEETSRRFQVRPDWAVCNHVSPGMVVTVMDLCDLEPGRFPHRGHEIGHVSSADIPFDLEKLLAEPALRPGQNIYAIGSGQHTWACSLFRVPR